MSEVITNDLALWSSALLNKSSAGRGSNVRQEAYGIKKLRELILQLAIVGRLVPQLDEDEPADLRLAAARSKLRSEGKGARRSAWKESAPLSAEEQKFALPKGWAWARVNDTGFYVNGLAFKPTDWGASGRPIIRIQNLTDPTKPLNYAQGDFPEEIIVRSGDLLVSWSATLDCFIWDREEAVLNQHIFKVSPCYELVTRRFLYWLLKFSIREMEVSDHAHGLVMTHINREPFLAHAVAIPPVAEQERIVAKVDELMGLCDQLEQQQTHSIEAHQTLVETLLGTLTRAASPQELTEAWTRIASHFDTLFTSEHSIDQLKQTILQLAVMGKLVPQDPSDEPANDLLEKIFRKKKRLVDEGVLRSQEPLPAIRDAEMPFALPRGWTYVRLGDISKLITKGSSPKWQGVSYTEDPGDVLFVTSENVGSYVLLLDKKKYVEKKFSEVEPRSILTNGDFLMNIVGASIGRTAIFDIDAVANINQAVCLIRVFADMLYSKFLLLFFNSATCVSYMFEKQVDNARANLSMGNIARFLIPLPPLAEQHRIVAKVDELMALCDALKALLGEAQTTQVHLAEAIVELAVA